MATGPTRTLQRALRLAALLVFAAVFASPPARSAQPRSLTLDQALDAAFKNTPRVRQLQTRVAAIEARLVGAGLYPHNPELEVAAAARIGPTHTVGDLDVGLSQAIELAGQTGKREALAKVEIQAARSEAARGRRLLAAEVRLAFLDALEGQAALDIARQEAELADQLLDLAQKRSKAGEGTVLDVNVASAELGRAEQRVGTASGRFLVARAVLAEVVGLPAGELPMPSGALAADTDDLPPLAELVDAAERHRADLVALRDLEDVARARIALASAQAYPDLTVRAFVRREDGTDTIVGAGLSIPLPVVQRNQGGIAVARAEARRVAAEREASRLSVVREVVASHERYRAGLKALASLRGRVIGTTEDNVKLLRKAFEAGKVGWTDVLVMRRALFDSRRAVVEATASVSRDRIRLDVATGRTPVPTPDTEDR